MDDEPKHSVWLTAMTQPEPGATSCATPAELLAYFARVSSAANQDKHLTGPRLIRRLIRDAEWSPLDMVTLNFEVHTSRRIARQMLRHWTIRFQEFSQRWSADIPPTPYLTPARMAVPGQRAEAREADPLYSASWIARQMRVWEAAWVEYQDALKEGQHPETACVVLPEGMAPSRMHTQATLRTWYHYSWLRMKPNTQAEHRLLAEQVWAVLVEKFPVLGEINELA